MLLTPMQSHAEEFYIQGLGGFKCSWTSKNGTHLLSGFNENGDLLSLVLYPDGSFVLWIDMADGEKVGIKVKM